MLAGQGGIAQPQNQIGEAVKAMLAPLVNHINSVSQGMMRVVDAQQNIAMTLDVTRLTMFTLVEMLIEKDVFTKEEWDGKYQIGVVEKIKKAQEEFESNMRAAQAAQAAQDAKEEAVENTSNSDVILPSERGEVVRFPG